jgi:hypothetical protein
MLKNIQMDIDEILLILKQILWGKLPQYKTDNLHSVAKAGDIYTSHRCSLAVCAPT